LRENNILGHPIIPRSQKSKKVVAVTDLLLAGTSALQDEKRIPAFIDRHTFDGLGFRDELED
jgi:hypothetical protein